MWERWRPGRASLLLSYYLADLLWRREDSGGLGELKTLAGSTPMVIKVLQCLRTCLSSHVNLLPIQLPPCRAVIINTSIMSAPSLPLASYRSAPITGPSLTTSIPTLLTSPSHQFHGRPARLIDPSMDGWITRGLLLLLLEEVNRARNF